MLEVRWLMRNIIIGIILSIVTFIAGYFKGEYDKGVDVALQVTKANEASAEKEKQLTQVAVTYATVLREKENNANKKIQALRNDVASGNRRLFIPVSTQAPNCSVQATTDAPITSGSDTRETRAELDRKTSDDLIAITAEGDSAIRKLNTCINQYNEIKDKLNDAIKH